MRDIILDHNCDRGMLIPQPTRYANNAQELINALVEEGPWDEATIGVNDKCEIIGEFLRDNPQYCPKRLILMIEPMARLKLCMWLNDKTEIVQY